MSDIYAVFKFSLRGKDSLASKWIDEKRNPQRTLKENDANIFAIGDYLYEVLCIEKLTEGKTTRMIYMQK